MFLPNRNGDRAESPASCLKRSSLGQRTRIPTGWCFTLRTKVARFTNGSDSLPTPKCVSSRPLVPPPLDEIDEVRYFSPERVSPLWKRPCFLFWHQLPGLPLPIRVSPAQP